MVKEGAGLAPKGNGCAHCEGGYPIFRVESQAGNFHLCLECLLDWFPGKDTAWFEARHAPFRDHLAFRRKQAIKREAASPAYQEALARFRASARLSTATGGA